MKHRLENFLTFFAPRPMSFMDAVAAMEQGKRVKRKIWDNENYYIYFNPTSAPDKNCLCGADGDLAGLDATDFRATDWEIVEEGD